MRTRQYNNYKRTGIDRHCSIIEQQSLINTVMLQYTEDPLVKLSLDSPMLSHASVIYESYSHLQFEMSQQLVIMPI